MIQTFPQIIDQAAEHLPDKEAFRIKGQGITYSALVTQANTLAYSLRDQGVKRGDRVGIYLNKSLALTRSIYGIWKAGAAYVPLDPAAPVSRLQSLIQDCGIRHLITEPGKSKQVTQLCEDTDLECLIGLGETEHRLQRTLTWDMVDTAPTDGATALSVNEQDLAYIMYTSGSTGVPKGLMHTHRSGLSYAKLVLQTYDIHEQDRLSNHPPLHFDMSTFGYFCGPLARATTVIIPEEHTLFPASLSALIQDEKITLWYSVPFALIQLLMRGVLAERDLSSLRWVLYGGEPFPPKHLRALMELIPGARFGNVYGPAEVNQCTYYHIPKIPSDSTEPIPIGKIWSETKGLVIDEDDNVVSEGEIGELLICSPTMMRGYWNRPDLNERAFYYHSAGADKPDIYYRTGDLVQLQPDGNYKFLGRKDRQAKIRGYRVELDEIEFAILTFNDVEETAVYVSPDGDGNQQLKAAIILKENRQASKALIRQHLAQRLPRYAVPTEIDFLDTFPRTSSGKIDRRALQTQMHG